MSISLLDGSLSVGVFYDPQDNQYDDNICLCIQETCPEEEKIFFAGETNMYISAEQARQLADVLIKAADLSSHGSR
jgi:hypothetical protein